MLFLLGTYYIKRLKIKWLYFIGIIYKSILYLHIISNY